MFSAEAELAVLEIEYLTLKSLQLSPKAEIAEIAQRRAGKISKEIERLRQAVEGRTEKGVFFTER